MAEEFNFYNFNVFFTPKPGFKTIVPDPVYNPNNAARIYSGTKLARGVTIGKFLGGAGEVTTLNHITSATDRLQLARQLYLQAYAMNTINENEGKFRDHRLIVVEGLYIKGANETLVSGGLNDLATKGQVVVYQLLDMNGRPDHAKMFDMAVYWKDSLLYDKLILDYDTFNPDGSLECHVILQMPVIGADFTAKFSKDLETRYNGNLQTAGELVEILS